MRRSLSSYRSGQCDYFCEPALSWGVEEMFLGDYGLLDHVFGGYCSFSFQLYMTRAPLASCFMRTAKRFLRKEGTGTLGFHQTRRFDPLRKLPCYGLLLSISIYHWARLLRSTSYCNRIAPSLVAAINGLLPTAFLRCRY